MKKEPLTLERLDEIADAVAEHGGIKPAAKVLGLTRSAVQRAMRQLKAKGRVSVAPRAVAPLPSAGKITRYILTCAQSNTDVHSKVWTNLMALASHYEAKVLVSRFTYMKEAYGQKSVKPGKEATEKDKAELWYDKAIEGFVSDAAIELAPGLVWCGDMNIMPTAVRPLSGLESYTGRKSGIFPHVKFAMESIASGKFEAAKLNYTTGTVTLRNYVEKKIGKRAEFHHGYGGLLVEVNSAGSWWVRQLNADSEGTIYDLTLRAKGGKVTDGHRVEGINWGDIHVGTVPAVVERACWGPRPAAEGGSMIDVLRPKYQFFNDVINFHSRNSHEIKNPHKRFQRYVNGQDSVMKELVNVVAFFEKAGRKDVRSIIVDSNHDNGLERWLREGDYRFDEKNALFFLEAQLAKYKAMAAKNDEFHCIEWAFNHLAPHLSNHLRFLRQDESFVICPDANGGIECGMHGHLGPNGARGSAAAFSKMGRKSNVGHTHAAAIHDGTYVAGVVGSLDQGYNAGPSNWTHSNVITYRNGKRAICTIWGGRWKA